MDYNTIPMEKFKFANKAEKVSDKKFETKPVSYAKDVWTRFCKNKSSVVAAVIIILLVLFAIFVPMFCENTYTLALTDTKLLEYKYFRPRIESLVGSGFWDGGKDETVNMHDYNMYKALEKETGRNVIMNVYRGNYVDGADTSVTFYDLRYDTYQGVGVMLIDLTREEFEDMQRWQDETGIQLILPMVNYKKMIDPSNPRKGYYIAERYHSSPDRAAVWYQTDKNGMPLLVDGEFVNVYATTNEWTSLRYTDPKYYSYDSLRIEGDDGTYIYSEVSVSKINDVESVNYSVRVDKYSYFQYRYGLEPSFVFGTNEKGQDILTRLASGARFSLVLAVCISAINLFIGAIYGAIEGFYGGIVDLAMERFSDILGGMPSMVVMSLFQLHLASKVGPVWSMAFAFILTGWLGMAARTRMQFYRFKRQEYVLSARTLGASDRRLMFKHIFPNAMGTLITGSVLSIPGVIFSESSLTYLGIVNLEGSTQTSVGTLLSNASDALTSNPHLILFPALFISLLEISFNLFGNGLRDAFNPSLKGVE